jgi:DNA anti-recombination protein RmuC
MGAADKEMEQNEKNIHTDGLLTVQQFAALVGKSPQSIYKRLNKVDNLVDNQVVNPIQPYVVVVDGQKMLKTQALSELYGIEVEQPIQPGCQLESEKLSTPFNQVEQPIQLPADEKSSDEIAFLREQIRRQDTMIESLNKELEKEREHNREKDRQLLDTLSKLAETQAALAAGQNAEKQKALAETLIEGQQMMDGEHKEQPEPIEEDFEEGFQKESKKQGLLQRIWAAITNK